MPTKSKRPGLFRLRPDYGQQAILHREPEGSGQTLQEPWSIYDLIETLAKDAWPPVGEINRLYDDMVSPHSALVTDVPRTKNPFSGENKLASSLDKLDVMQESYRQAIEYMAWFEPAWSSLTDEGTNLTARVLYAWQPKIRGDGMVENQTGLQTHSDRPPAKQGIATIFVPADGKIKDGVILGLLLLLDVL